MARNELQRASRITGVPVWLLAAVMGQESGGNNAAVSPKGARGRMQLMPGTAAGLERKYGINTKTPWGNLLGGAYYLAQQHRTFKRWDWALAAYNAGPNAVRDYHGVPPYKETQDYVRNIMGKKPAGGAAAGRALGPQTPELGSIPNGAPPTPSYTKQDAAMEGLQALAQGNYDPQAGLAALRKASAAAMEAAQQGMTAADVVAPQFKFQGNKASPLDQRAVALAKRYLGVQYVWGGSTPKGFDCSGLIQWVWGHLGVKIPRTTYQQINAGRPVSKGQLRPGDAIFFGTRKNPHHVGMYIGGGRYIQAPKTGDVVKISNLGDRGDYVTARRYG